MQKKTISKSFSKLISKPISILISKSLNKSGSRSQAKSTQKVSAKSRKSNHKIFYRWALVCCALLIGMSLLALWPRSAQAQGTTFTNQFDPQSKSDRDPASIDKNSLQDLVRQKKYRGAQDEEELKVQAFVPNSKTVKVKKDESVEGF